MTSEYRMLLIASQDLRVVITRLEMARQTAPAERDYVRVLGAVRGAVAEAEDLINKIPNAEKR